MTIKKKHDCLELVQHNRDAGGITVTCMECGQVYSPRKEIDYAYEAHLQTGASLLAQLEILQENLENNDIMGFCAKGSTCTRSSI